MNAIHPAAGRRSGYCSDIERPFRYDLHRNFIASPETPFNRQ